jgi:hypothetical protein
MTVIPTVIAARERACARAHPQAREIEQVGEEDQPAPDEARGVFARDQHGNDGSGRRGDLRGPFPANYRQPATARASRGRRGARDDASRPAPRPCSCAPNPSLGSKAVEPSG